MSNTLWKIRFSNYEPIDLRDIQSYSIEQNVDDTSPIREGEMNEEIEREFKDTILYRLDHCFEEIIEKINFLKDEEDERIIYEGIEGVHLYSKLNSSYFESYLNLPKRRVLGYLLEHIKVEDLKDFYDNIEKCKEKHLFAKEDIFKWLREYEKEIKEYLILEKRKKLFTVEFYLKDRTTVKWGTYKTKEEAEIVYNKVDAYFKKTFEHFYKKMPILRKLLNIFTKT